MIESRTLTVETLRRKKLFRAYALFSALVLWISAEGCVCFQPIEKKVEQDPTAGECVVKREEMPVPCQVLSDTIGVVSHAAWLLSWVMPRHKPENSEEARRAEEEYGRVMRGLSERK